MEKNIKNIEINSEILNNIKEREEKYNIDIDNLKKCVLKQNPLLNFIDIFEKSPLFVTKFIQKGELLFDEGSIDNNLYIIKKGILSVEKYTTIQKTDTKQLAILKTGDFLGESSIDKTNNKKEALIKAIKNSEILAIDAKIDLKKFIEENPTIGYELLTHIIVETNKRLIESNKIITINYEIDKQIKTLTVIDMKNIFGLIDKIKLATGIDYIIYIEKHQIIDNFFILKYDSRQPNKMQDIIFERKGYFLDLDELYKKANIKPEDKIIINKLAIGNEIYGFLIFGREKYSFSGSDKKIFISITNSFVGILKKFFTDKDNLSKLYIDEMKKI